MRELFDLYRRCFPCCVREEAFVRELLSSCSRIEERDENENLIGAAVIEANNILLLCVDKSHRNRGVGSRLLAEAETRIRREGHAKVTVGAGAHYIMPGVPTIKPMPGDNLAPAAIDPRLEDHSGFFLRRGYVHGWDCSCFDMRMELSDFSARPAPDTLTYRFAGPANLPATVDCAADAHEPFAKYYRNPALYEASSPSRALIAEAEGKVVGALIVSLGTEGPGLGSVGCTAVRPSHQGRGIATNLVILGTRSLRESGMREAFLGYTYSGLDRLYGRAGYRICAFYFMSEKALP